MKEPAVKNRCSWADHSTFVVQKVGRMTSAVINATTSYGLELNFKKGKTELMLAIRGSGCKAVQSSVFGNGQRVMNVETANFGTIQVGITTSYIHLGCAVEKDMQFKAEGARRAVMAAAAVETHRGLIFSTRISVATRGKVFTILVDMTYFNLELWTTGHSKPWQKLVASHTKLMRRLFAKDIEASRL